MDKLRSYDPRVVIGWLKKHNFLLVLVMSLLHIGLAYIHTRDSGRDDYYNGDLWLLSI